MSAVDYIKTIDVRHDRLHELAKDYDNNVFLPASWDIKDFNEKFNIKPKTTTRAKAAPKIFEYLNNLDAETFNHVIIYECHSISKLAPISDAISRARKGRRI